MVVSHLDALVEVGWTRISVLIAGALLLWSFGTWVHQLLTDPLKDIPGPTLARFTGLWLFTKYAGGQFHKINLELHRKYGPVVRIAPNQYSIDDPEAAKLIYGHGTQFTKSDWYQPWGHPDFINLFNDQNPKTHAQLRRQLSQLYSMSSLISYEGFVDECITILNQRLSEMAKAGTKVNIGHWLQCYAFDVIGKITFSYRFGFLDDGVDIMNLMHELDGLNYYCSIIGVFPFYHQIMAYFIRLFKLGGQGTGFIDNYCLGVAKSAAQEKIPDHGTVDFVRKLLKARKNEPAHVTTNLIRNAAGANMIAGSDTTSISLSSVLYHLYRSPTALARLRQELTEYSQAGKISDNITFKEAQNLPYLQAVIKEGLRVHPATGFTMPRVVPVGGATILGRNFPQGTVVGINSWVAHANKAVFGEDANLFRPERWLEAPELDSRRDLYFFTFGQGSRTCIGKNISLLEICKAIPQLVQKFDFDLGSQAAWNCRNNWFVKPIDFECKVREVGGHAE